ncbi:mitochondrial coenzyme A transporter SLC25A42 [Maniola jurtina]|uniref:mitochondrial coenzyme A transporter SLC25A42 n=1 Tax=Maniola jurtina TaxID=191418 RepID=UPI001E6887CB|nr:mitochondrial coenzyme A transporter SLC25A42 [Maniola jurtina]XP_045783224.1 mitochondrial coenzyme A transporter SLC25A42 [Maniola jurtina]XP_045783225.1 mitochondrial coenzyme A transporter SLC25A42 [Maniola jurtina]XP_045783226.1 mitochondrial coenzyme A transporter SLC25A42 [Maniola jurtina]XP_045783227.1 mitochondrial coenzyme A transporter SLC25A42 [Maniola jurtina]
MAVGEARVPLLREERLAHHGESAKSKQLSGTALVVTSLLSGAAAGALAKTVIAPLDRTKINFQTSEIPYSARAAVRFIAHSARTEGFVALWRGNSATMARIIPYAAIQFTAHEQWKRVLGVDTPQTAQESPVRLLVAGSLAGVTSQSATYPLDLARARMAVADYRSLRAVFTRVLREEGPVTLYRGFPATVLGVIPYAGVSFFTYDTLRHWYLDYTGSSPRGITNMACGGVAGALAQTASYPLDIVRRRMQTARRRADKTYPYPTILDTLATVYRLEGWRGFFKGLSMNWVKGPIAVGISFSSYDAIKRTLRDVSLTLTT